MHNSKPDDLTIIGRVNFRSDRRPFGIRRADRRQHMYLIGKTGTGKSSTILSLFISDMRQGEGCTLIDPHGDLAEAVLRAVPRRRTNHVVYVDPSDLAHPPGLNVLEIGDRSDGAYEANRILVSSGVISVFRKLWADSWGPRLEHLLRNAILGLLEIPGSTLLGIPRLFVDAEYRERVTNRLRDPQVASFWKEEYPGYGRQFSAEASSPVLNKVGQFLSSSLIRNIVGQSRSTIDLAQVMDEGKILIVNLSKGAIGEDATSLLGSLLVTKLQLDAMHRISQAELERRDHWLYIDEWQNFSTDAFASILSESRKFRLGVTLAHQYLSQVDEKLSAAVLGNVGTLVAFRVGARDAESLAQELGPEVTPNDLASLDNYNAYIRLLVDGVPRTPFSLKTMQHSRDGSSCAAREIVVGQSRLRYTQPRQLIESRFERWLKAPQFPAS